MVVQDIVKDIASSLSASAHVSTVFGEPTVVGRKTIIPIASIGLGFGAGGAEGKQDKETEPQEGKAGGGGGGGSAKPIAVLEVTEEETRVISVIDLTKVILASLAFGGSIAFLLAKVFGTRKG